MTIDTEELRRLHAATTSHPSAENGKFHAKMLEVTPALLNEIERLRQSLKLAFDDDAKMACLKEQEIEITNLREEVKAAAEAEREIVISLAIAFEGDINTRLAMRSLVKAIRARGNE